MTLRSDPDLGRYPSRQKSVMNITFQRAATPY